MTNIDPENAYDLVSLLNFIPTLAKHFIIWDDDYFNAVDDLEDYVKMKAV